MRETDDVHIRLLRSLVVVVGAKLELRKTTRLIFLSDNKIRKSY